MFRKRHTCSSINCDSKLKGNLQTLSLNIKRFIFLVAKAKTYCPKDISLWILSSFYWVGQKVQLAFFHARLQNQNEISGQPNSTLSLFDILKISNTSNSEGSKDENWVYVSLTYAWLKNICLQEYWLQEEAAIAETALESTVILFN